MYKCHQTDRQRSSSQSQHSGLLTVCQRAHVREYSSIVSQSAHATSASNEDMKDLYSPEVQGILQPNMKEARYIDMMQWKISKLLHQPENERMMW